MNARLVALIAVAGGLAAYAFWPVETSAPPRVAAGSSPLPAQAPAPAPASGGDTQQGSLNPLSRLNAEAVADIAKRPLFNPTRAPAEQPQQAPEPVAEQPQQPVTEEPAQSVLNPGDYTLLAIASDGAGAMAVVRANATNEVFHVKRGQAFSNLDVVEIGMRDITLGRGGQTMKLELFKTPAPIGGGSTGAPASPSEPPQNNDDAGETAPAPPSGNGTDATTGTTPDDPQ